MVGKYIYYVDIDPEKPNGIQKKILSQLKAFNKGDNYCELYCVESEKDSRFRFFLQHLPIVGKKYNKWIIDQSFDSLDYLYIRRPSVFDGAFIKYLKQIKLINPKIKIIVELPTYPYDSEYSGLIGDFTRWIDRRHRLKMYDYIDAFAIVAWNSTETTLWKIPVLPISNGIDLEAINKINRNELVQGSINLLYVAYFSPWHGYEKFIESLGYYYKSFEKNSKHSKQSIYLHMVGVGPELDNYKSIAKEANVDDKVIFYGEINEGLDEIYEKCDIGVCSINSKKYGVTLSSQLKSREYLAKGMPIITCGDIDVLQSHDFPYELIVDYDRRIDFDRIIEFYNKRIRPDSRKATEDIRAFAEKTCGWSATMRTVLEYLGIKGDENNV